VAVTDVAVAVFGIVNATPPTDTVGRSAELVFEHAPLAAAQKPVPVIVNDVGVPAAV
jgi:2',3'-cyclic-nucleotide 2'-phosphodiesterase (5'-nucleotidase family)